MNAAPTPTPSPASPWHPGELAIQRSIGVAERMDAPGRQFIRDHMPEQHRSFYPLLHFVVLGSVDAQGDAWATVRAGRAGFLRSPSPQTLHVALERDAADPADAGMADGRASGLLGIDPMTRRRNRLNGTVRRGPAPGRGFDIAVAQSFGNCPQYIQSRSLRFVRDPAEPGGAPAVEHSGLDERARAMVSAADTFYVASYIDGEDGTRQVDVSHRGGKPGFVRVDEDGLLTIPDFSGNKFFMTLGNLRVNPRAGLLFVDPATGDMLQMTGEARVVLQGPEIAAFEGAERLWTFRPRRVLHRPDGLPLRWRMAPDGWSPNLALTGSWPQAAQRLAAAALAGQWRPFRVLRAVDESAGVRSLLLAPADGRAAAPALPGQHLPVRLTLADGTRLVRSYTLSSLSSTPADGPYRISVKKQGLASSHLHALAEGAQLEARAPAGSFTVDASLRRPAVLLAAGIGITPLLAMLQHLVHEGRRTRYLRPAWLFQSARTLAERPFDAEIAALVDSAQGAVRWVRVLSQPGQAQPGRDFEHAGRIDMGLLQATLPPVSLAEHDFYLCGPAAFMQASYDGLRALGVPDAGIHAEAFGPSGLRRAGGADPVAAPLPPPATAPVRIVFGASGVQADWRPGEGSLLDLAEAQGLAPAFGCRGGHCGSCATRVVQGAVTYAERPAFAVPPGEALLCCAVPAPGQQAVQLAV